MSLINFPIYSKLSEDTKIKFPFNFLKLTRKCSLIGGKCEMWVINYQLKVKILINPQAKKEREEKEKKAKEKRNF